VPQLRDRSFDIKTCIVKILLLLFHGVVILLVAYLFAKKWQATTSRLYWSAFGYKMIAGAGLGLIYLFYYSANDTWAFYEQALKVSSMAKTDFVLYAKMLADYGEEQGLLAVLPNHDLRSVFFVKLVSVFTFLTAGSYWLTAAYFSLISFLASWYLHQTVTRYFTGSQFASAFAFLFFPSVVFWSSGIEKETFALGGIYYLTALALKLANGEKVRWYYLLLAVVACVLVWNLKYYWAAVFFISMATAALVWILSRRFLWISNHTTVVWISIFVGAGLAASFTHPNFCLTRFLEVLVANHNDFVAISGGRNLIHYHQLSAGWQSVAINTPWALASGLFRPFVGEGNGLLGLVASLENCVLLVLFVSALVPFRFKFEGADNIFLYAALSYIIVLCIFLALSTPNLGSLSRYRVGFLPFFVFLVTYKNSWLQNRFWSTRL
jgi:hypothetical protein